MDLVKNDRRRVAIIEDDPFWQYQLRHNLNAIDANLEIRVLSSAEEFLDEAGRAFDLVISDHNLGYGQSGPSVWRHLQSHNPDIAFALTSGSGELVFDELTQAGMLVRPVLIEKPYRFQTFKAQIEAMFASRGIVVVEKDVDWNKIFSTMMFSSAVIAIATVAMHMEAFSGNQPQSFSAEQVLQKIEANVKDHRQAYVSDATRARMLKILAHADRLNKLK